MKEATTKHNFNGDSNPSIALAWAGDNGDTILAVRVSAKQKIGDKVAKNR